MTRSSRPLVPLLAIAIAVLAGGCAYFNMFYYAKSQYKLAFPSTRDGYLAENVTPSQTAALDSSLVRSRRLIARYHHSRWLDDAYLLAGKAYYGRGKYDDAINQLSALLDSFPKSPLRAEATTFLGAAYVKAGKTDRGREILATALTDYPKFDHWDYTLFLLAESYRTEKRYDDAFTHYKSIVEGRHGSDIWDEAALQAGLCLERLGRYEDARGYLGRVGRRKVSADLRHQALVTVGETWLEEKKYADAERAFRAVLDDVTDPQGVGRINVATARIRIAEAQAGEGNFADAIKTLQQVIDDAPRTPSAAEAQYEIGYILEVRKHDARGAREAYGHVREILPSSQFTTRAEARAKNLERLSALRSQGPHDPAETAFTEAEILLLDLEKPDEALARYQTIRRRYPHSEFARKAAYAIAWTRLRALRDSAGARAEFEDLVRRYPETIYADDARYALARLGVVSPDSTPLPIDEVALARDSVVVVDSLAPFEAVADSIARAEALADTLAAHAKADSLARLTATRDSLSRNVARLDSIARAKSRSGGPRGRTGDADPAELRRRPPATPPSPTGNGAPAPTPSPPGPSPADTTRSRER